MSPLQGAMIAATIANDGVMMRPYLVEDVVGPRDHTIYESHPEVLSQVINAETAKKMRALMRATIESGTSRKSFRSIASLRHFSDVEFGGKTGSLKSRSPSGKCDWFVGYSRTPGAKVAVAAVMVNVNTWKLRSSTLAGRFFSNYHRLQQQIVYHAK
jgi:peptidoglycan glycosyltransferase